METKNNNGILHEIDHVKVAYNSIKVVFTNGNTNTYEARIESDAGMFSPYIKLSEYTRGK